MTVEEIKAQYSMTDVLSMYGLKTNRAGFCSCPFHGRDAHPSMKIYAKDYHCFTCGANGDIFSFVQGMENCSFKDAFLKLGGAYEKKTSWQKKRFEYELRQKKEREKQELEEKKRQKRDLINSIKIGKLETLLYPVFSDEWCKAVNRFEMDMIKLEKLNEEGVKIYD